jgi:hypothetical protein
MPQVDRHLTKVNSVDRSLGLINPAEDLGRHRLICDNSYPVTLEVVPQFLVAITTAYAIFSNSK